MLSLTLSAVALISGALPGHAPRVETIKLSVDATDINRCIVRVVERLPAKAGKFAIHYPTWLPGNHGPSGPINDVVRFHAYVDGQEVNWTRNPVDMFEIDLQTPADTQQVELQFVVATPPGTSQGSQFGRLNWNRVVFLPDGKIDSIFVTPSLLPPTGWTVFTALSQQDGESGRVNFKTVTADELVDSPAELGRNAKSYLLDERHHFDVLTQKPEELDLNPLIIQDAKNLVAETGALFHGSRHYRDYHFLMTFGNVAFAGLEHHESSEVGLSDRELQGPYSMFSIGGLISHEMFHSWNGKHRRPAGLTTPDFTTPQQSELLWIYEGMTQYYGNVLAARSGFFTPELARGDLAEEIGVIAAKPGRLWRPLSDTAVAASILRSATSWTFDRRQQDYYSEGVGLWLEADCIIRDLTHNAKSLDDFVLAFEGGRGGSPTTIPYNLKEVETKLAAVAPYDWHEFFQSRVFRVRPDLKTSVSKSGWKLVFDDGKTPFDGAAERPLNLLFDLGANVDTLGRIQDLALDLPLEKSGAAINDVISTVNGSPFSKQKLEDAIGQAVRTSNPMNLTVLRDGAKLNLSVDYHGGRKRPRLERIEGSPDYLSDILKARRS
jgi:predicted metalloprotease with PDZ domain